LKISIGGGTDDTTAISASSPTIPDWTWIRTGPRFGNGLVEVPAGSVNDETLSTALPAGSPSISASAKKETLKTGVGDGTGVGGPGVASVCATDVAAYRASTTARARIATGRPAAAYRRLIARPP
jgi:hypothetical protein